MFARPATAVVSALALLAAACGEEDTSAPNTSAPAGDGVTADLTIQYEHSEADVAFEYGIECGPDSNALTGAAEQAEIDASAACEALDDAAVVERLVDGPPDDQVCTEIYGGADVAGITGSVSGQDVDATVDRTNGCGIADWDDLLDPILPPAIGVASPTTSG